MPRCSLSITGASKTPAHLAPAAPVACRVSSFQAMPAAMASRTRSSPAGPAATLACAASVVPAPKIVHAAPGAPSPAAELTCPAPAGPEGRCARGRPAPAVPAAILVCPAPNNGCMVTSSSPFMSSSSSTGRQTCTGAQLQRYRQPAKHAELHQHRRRQLDLACPASAVPAARGVTPPPPAQLR